MQKQTEVKTSERLPSAKTGLGWFSKFSTHKNKSQNLIKWPPKIMRSSGVYSITKNISTKKSAPIGASWKNLAWAGLYRPEMVSNVLAEFSLRKFWNQQMGFKKSETLCTPWITYLGSIPKRSIQKVQSLNRISKSLSNCGFLNFLKMEISRSSWEICQGQWLCVFSSPYCT